MPGDASSIPKSGRSWRRKWQPTPVLLPRKFHRQKSLVGYSPRNLKESDMIEHACMLSSLDVPADKFLAPKVRFCNVVRICITRSCKVWEKPRPISCRTIINSISLISNIHLKSSPAHTDPCSSSRACLWSMQCESGGNNVAYSVLLLVPPKLWYWVFDTMYIFRTQGNANARNLYSHYSEKDILSGLAKLPPVRTVVFFDHTWGTQIMVTAWPDSSAFPPERGCDVLSLSTTAVSAQVLLPPWVSSSSSNHPWCGYWSQTHTHTHTHSFTFLLIPSCPFLVAQMVKSPPAIAGDTDSIPGCGRYPGEGNGNHFQYSCLGNPMDRGACWATVHRITKESDMTEGLTLPVLVFPLHSGVSATSCLLYHLSFFSKDTGPLKHLDI